MPMPSAESPSRKLRQNAVVKIQDATNAIQQYKLKGARFDELVERQEIRHHIIHLIKEAVAVGGSGEACHRCGGSGREPGR